MGWSCREKAGKTMDKWTAACVHASGQQNTFSMRGRHYFWERSRTEHADGAITGSVWRMQDDGRCKRTGTFRIEPEGHVSRAPKFLQEAAE